MKYIYASAEKSRNYGDCIIEYASKQIISEYLPEPNAIQDMFDVEMSSEDFDFMIIPGVTMLTPNARPFLKNLSEVPYPIYCLAGNYWTPSLPKPGFLFKNAIRMKGAHETADLSVAKYLQQPVGVRDPYTRYLLEAGNITTKFLGCPTIHLKDDGVGDDGFVLFSFGRKFEYTQVKAAHHLAKKHHVVCICHEPDDYDRLKAAGLKLPLIDYDGDIELYLSYFRRASIVVSGRLHGILPSVAFHKPVFYFGTNDSRTTFLEVLGVRIHHYKDIKHAAERAVQSVNQSAVAYFKKQWDEVLKGIKSRHNG